MAYVNGGSPNGPDPTLTAVRPSGRDIEFPGAPDLVHPMLNADSVLPFIVQGVADGTPLSGFDPDAADRPGARQSLKAFQPHGVLSDSLPASSRP